MASKDKEQVAGLTERLARLLEPFDSVSRSRAVAAVLTLLGEDPVPRPRQGTSKGGGQGLSFKEAISLYQTQASLTDRIWWYFATVSVAVLGFTIGSKTAQASPQGLTIFSVGYFLFALGNGYSLVHSQRDLVALGGLARRLARDLGSEAESVGVECLSVRRVAAYYAVIAIVVLLVLVSYWRSAVSVPLEVSGTLL